MSPAGNYFDANERAHERPPRVFGFVRAKVTANKGDPLKLSRVQVNYINLPQANSSSAWCRLATPMAGNAYGLCFIPEVGDEVAVIFEQGDIDLPVVAGSLWNGGRVPPFTNPDGKDNIRQIKSRSGHTITFDDTSGAEQVIIVDKTTKNTITIDSKNNVITITSSKDVQVNAQGNIALATQKGNVTIDCAKFTVTASQTVGITANGSSLDLNCKPGGVKLNTDGLVVR